jgi:hypothetical protein
MSYAGFYNYYESLVMARIEATLAGAGVDQDYLEDVACVALNQLPARYVRHAVDLIFYLTAEERAGMQRAVEQAVASAAAFVARHRGASRPTTLNHEEPGGS